MSDDDDDDSGMFHVDQWQACRGCGRPMFRARFCQACLDLPNDLPGVKNWKTKVAWANRCQDKIRVLAIQKVARDYRAIVLYLPLLSIIDKRPR